RNADGPRLVRDGARDRLADPPRGVGGELEPAAVLVLLRRLHEAGVAFLDDVEERETAVSIPLPDRHDEPEVSGRQLVHRPLVPLETVADVADAGAELLRRLEGFRPA